MKDEQLEREAREFWKRAMRRNLGLFLIASGVGGLGVLAFVALGAPLPLMVLVCIVLVVVGLVPLEAQP